MDSNIENPDLEDGEIEDDEEEQNIDKTPSDVERVSQSQTTPKSSSKGGKNNDKNPRGSITDDDFAGKIESMIAIVLKKDGIEPPLPEISRNQEKENYSSLGGQKQSKRKKRSDNCDREREKKKKLDKTLMEAEEDEFEFLCVRGASPPPIQQQQPLSTYPVTRSGVNDDSYDSDYSGSSYDSYSSADRHRINSYNTDKRNRNNRDRGQRQQRSGGQKEKHNKRHQSRSGGANGQNDVGLDSDDERNRKMELCKFYLMDCCAKRDKCLYMHSDFPCKYYYLGIRCIDKAGCKFLHGAPLTDNLRSILLKHLETAPKEILGDFPRLSRDNAIKMLDTTNQKLMIDYGLASKPVVTSSASSSGNNLVVAKIPSLLEINIAKPDSLIEKEENLMNKSLKPRRTRWCAPHSNTGGILLNPTIPTHAQSTIPPSTVTQTKHFLSLEFLTGVLSQTQIDDLQNLGIETLEQVNQLTVAQLNDLGLTVDQIRAIQLNAKNIQQLGLLGTSTTDSTTLPTASTTTTTAYGDLDMRIAAPIKTPPITTAETTSEILSLNPGGGDVDMRVLPIDSSQPADVKSPKIQDYPITQSTQPTSINTDYSKFMISPPSSIDYSKYLKDSNIENILENNSDSEEDENLKIDDDLPAIVTSSTSDSFLQPSISMTSPPIIPPASLTSFVSTKILTVPQRSYVLTPGETSPRLIPISSANPSQSPITRSTSVTSEITRIDFYNPRLSPTPSTTQSSSYLDELPTLPSLPIATPPTIISQTTTVDTTGSGKRVTIYDRSPNDDDDDDIDQDKQIKPDHDMRLHAFIHENSDSNGDIDFRLPFKPIPNYVPATEIDASFTSHSPIEYKLVKINIPKPDYSDIRRSFPIPNKTLDPRLRRIFALKELPNEKPYQDSSSPTDPFQTHVTTTQIDPGKIMPRVDPRRKNDLSSDSTTLMTQTSAAGNFGNKSLDIQTMLQNSLWYRDLSSKQKMSVNQHLATLSSDLKQFHLDSNPDKKFLTNIIIQQTLTNLGVYVNEYGDFIELCDNPGMSIGGMMNPMGGIGHKLPPNHMMNLMNMQSMDGGGGSGGFGMNPNGPNFNPHQPHPNMNQRQMFHQPKQFGDGGNIRPGLLGIAPNMPFNYDSNLAFQQQTLQFEEFIDNNINNNRFDRGDCSGGGGNRNFNRNNNFRGGGNMRNNNDRWRNTNMNRNNNNNMQRRPMYDRDNRRHD